MWDAIFHVLQVIGVIGATVGALIGGHLWLKEQKRQSVAKTKDELIKLATENADAWKSRFEVEHGEFADYRDKTHVHNNESNARIIALVTENEQLKSKTDLSPLMKMMQTFFAEQTAINQQILDGLTTLLTPKRKRKT